MVHGTNTCPAGGMEASPETRERADRTGRRRLPRPAGAGAACCAILALLAGGCAGEKLALIKGTTDFQQQVLQADRPVLVEFYKAACPTCELLAPSLDQLSDEYRGRVAFAKFESIPSKEIRKQYDVDFYPTVILFVNGQEKKRWVLHYVVGDYRKALDKVAAEATTQSVSVGSGKS